MRGLWDNEQPLSPALLRSALALVGAFLGLTSMVMLIISVASVANGNYAAAAMQLAAGVALPFGIWLGLRMLADMLIVMNRARDRLESIEEALSGRPGVAPAPVFQTNGAKAGREKGGRAGDDGPAYPAED
jgi:hypothetical protein